MKSEEPVETAAARELAALSAAEINDLIRATVAGRALWDPASLAELERLRGAWRAAVEREQRHDASGRGAVDALPESGG